MATPQQSLRDLCLTAARQIAAECRGGESARIPQGEEEKGQNGASTPARLASRKSQALDGCGAPLVDLLGRQAAHVLRLGGEEAEAKARNAPGDAATKVERRLADLADLAHARFYAYAPRDVPPCWRQLYTDACVLQFALRWLLLLADKEDDGGPHRLLLDEATLDRLVRPLDMALILAGGAGPADRGQAWIHAALEALHQTWDGEETAKQEDEEDDDQRPSSTPPKKRQRRENDGADEGGRQMSQIHHHRQHDWSTCPTFADLVSSSDSVFVPPVSHPVPRSGPLGLEAFQAYLDRWRRPRGGVGSGDGGDGPQPLVMAGLTEHWPARRRADGRPWSVPAYLRWRTLGGRRLVPVEVGRSYVDDGWTQAVVPFAAVLAELGAADGHHKEAVDEDVGRGKTGPTYLAQHALFAQIPQLRDDIAVPDACYTSTGDLSDADGDDDDDNFPLINAWLGPAGTITPLHTDPHHNLLAQVVGRKYVRLYEPGQSAALRPRGREAGVDMGNTSTVDVGAVEGWDDGGGGGGERADMLPSTTTTNDSNSRNSSKDRDRFRQIPFVDCILEPGDTLYIPEGWWHYVRSLSVSFSVSFWWN